MSEQVPQRFGGKVALLTGAASGIGRATAQRLASEGARVFAVDVAADGLDALAKEITGAGGTVTTLCASVADHDGCSAVVDAALEEFGQLDVLGNIAGVSTAAHFTDTSEADYRRMFAVNADGPFFLCQAAIPSLLESGGNIVNIASNAGLMGTPYTVAYSMTKGAVVQLTRSLAAEYAKTTLRVNAIAPGGVSTGLTKAFRVPDGADFELMAPMVGHRGFGEPDDIAALFALVASEEGKNMHGAILSSDGGLTAC